jgi:hypothetical protein
MQHEKYWARRICLVQYDLSDAADDDVDSDPEECDDAHADSDADTDPSISESDGGGDASPNVKQPRARKRPRPGKGGEVGTAATKRKPSAASRHAVLRKIPKMKHARPVARMAASDSEGSGGEEEEEAGRSVDFRHLQLKMDHSQRCAKTHRCCCTCVQRCLGSMHRRI